MTTNPIRLSICIPTYSRANLLEVCLSSVLPQVEMYQGEVECIVSNNASTDDTSRVIESYGVCYPFLRSENNDSNIGIIGNITKAASELARGDYVWLIGDDDVLAKESVSNVLEVIRQPNAPDLIALNVGYLPREERPTAEFARGGVSVCCTKTLRQTHESGRFRFEELFEGPPADWTASYSVVLKHELWLKHFPKASFEPPFSSLSSTYPSGYIIAHSMPGKEAALIAEPSVIVYEMPGSEFSWAKYRGLTSIYYLTELLRLFESQGVPRSVMAPYYRYQLEHRSEELSDLLWNPNSAGGYREAIGFGWSMKRYPWKLFKMFLLSCNSPYAPRLISWLPRVLLRLKQLQSLGQRR